MFRFFLVVLVAVLGLLYLYNPDVDDFRRHVQAQAEQRLQRELGDSAWGSLLSGVGSDVAGSLVEHVSEQQDYLIFSTYVIDLDGDHADDAEWRYLGIAGQFIQLESPGEDPNR